MNEEFARLSPAHQEAVRQAVRQCRGSGKDHRSPLPKGGEVYAYPHRDGTSWGVNGGADGFCEARGVWPKGKPA